MVSGYTTSNPARTRVTRLIWSWKEGGGRLWTKIEATNSRTGKGNSRGVQMRSTSAFHGLRYFRNFPILIPLYRRSFPTLFHSPRLSPNYTENFHASSRLIARSRLFKRRRREDRIDLTLFICLYSRGTACARNLGYHKRSGNLKICIYRLLLVFISLSRVPWDICKLNCIGIFKNYSIVSMASFPQSS